LGDECGGYSKIEQNVTKNGQVDMWCSFKEFSAELNSPFGIECIIDVVRRSRLQWFGQVERKVSDD